MGDLPANLGGTMSSLGPNDDEIADYRFSRSREAQLAVIDMMRSEFKSAPPFMGALLTGFSLDVEQGFGNLYSTDSTDSSQGSIDRQLRKVTRDLVEAFTEAARKGEEEHGAFTKWFPGAPRDVREDSTLRGSDTNAENIDFGAVKQMTLTELFEVSRPTSRMSSSTASAPTSSSSADLDSHATSDPGWIEGDWKPLPFESVWQMHALYEKLDSLKWNPGNPERSAGMEEDEMVYNKPKTRLKALLRQLTRPFFYNYLPAFMLDLTELRGKYLTEVDTGAAIQNKVLAFVASSSIALFTFLLKDKRVGEQVNLVLKQQNITSAFQV